jgi:predicted acylesterase/phospholipase RssA
MIHRLKITIFYCYGLTLFLSGLQVAMAQADTPPDKVPMALAISGGISLGSYEAGLNWAIVKQLKIAQQDRDYRVDQYPPTITAISGASAGGINALVSAISWCMDDRLMNSKAADNITDNLFRDIWLGVGFDNLLPADPRDYEATDGLLSRNAFDLVIDRIRELLGEKIYRTDCRVPVGLTVTRTVPIVMNVNGIRVRNQRFVIPIELVSDRQRPGYIKLLSPQVNTDEPLFGNVIYLQARSDTRTRLDIESVVQAMLATSAFPVAFGRVRLDYCIPQGVDIISPNSIDPDRRCPAGYVQESAYFVDGGVFDNVPLGLAKAMAEASPKPQHSQYNYVYLDPGNRRPFRLDMEVIRDKSSSFGLKSQLYFIGGAIQTGEQYELYNVLRSDDWSGKGNRRILLTSRHPPVTGKFLAHFGAFIDSSFREYDYYAGIYDALINISEYRCHVQLHGQPPQADCLAREAKKVHQALFRNASQPGDQRLARQIIALLARNEYGNQENAADWQWAWQVLETTNETEQQSNALVVARALLSLDEQQQDPSLEQLIAELPQDFKLDDAGFMIRRIIKHRYDDPAKWFYPLASRASVRLLDLEKEEHRVTGESLRTLAGGAALGIETLLGDADDFVWNQSTGKDDWFKLLPYEISYDLSNNGWGAAWEPRWQVRDHWSLNFKLTPIAVQRANNQRKMFSQVDILASFKVADSLISSWGMGPTYSKLRSPQPDARQENIGVAAYIGLLGDKLRLTVGKRAETGDFFGDETYVYIGITDIPGISYWVKRTYY